MSEAKVEEDEQRLRDYRVSAAREEYERLTAPTIQNAVRPLIERETRDLYDAMTVPTFMARPIAICASRRAGLEHAAQSGTLQ